ncbi:iron-containing alcohol dehydrogenase family protein [Rhizobium lusitanum]|uniref:iron-containing alcohol dehydrogenase family protein n=1 Tax=Rhizobium lusitanum TaxID=293958 RepID=UPI0015738097|nr:iron-containing alcohol dehydrogenase family protein [Rhizobium lusitanum]NTJ11818.1 iron-containing alcohol dehydrogenase [Rhizobium lusitanum]
MTDTENFQFINSPLRLFHGEDSLRRLGSELDRLGCKRAVIFSGPFLEGALLDRIREAVGNRLAGIYTGTLAHSPIPSVIEAANELRRLEADAVVAVGGGSVIVTSRAAAILLAEGTDVRSLCTVRDGSGGLKSPKLMAPKLPQFVVPTTPATASVKAGSALFDPETGDRLALFDPKTRAQAVFYDPTMLMSAPRSLVINASINTFATAVEGLVSKNGNPIADALLMHSIRLAGSNLRELPSGDNEARRGDLALAAVLCGQGTDHTGAGITTVLGHAIGARHEVDNGLVNAVVLPHVLRFNANAAPSGLSKVAAALSLPQSGPEVLEAVLDETRRILVEAGAPTQLRDLKVPVDHLKEIAVASMGDWFLGGNPRKVTDAGQINKILEEAW